MYSYRLFCKLKFPLSRVEVITFYPEPYDDGCALIKPEFVERRGAAHAAAASGVLPPTVAQYFRASSTVPTTAPTTTPSLTRSQKKPA